MSQNVHHKTSQTALKYYNQFRTIRTEAIRWSQLTTDKRKKLEVETGVK